MVLFPNYQASSDNRRQKNNNNYKNSRCLGKNSIFDVIANIKCDKITSVKKLRGEQHLEKGKSIDALMRHIRNDHNVSINGGKNKKSLMNIGYYHGYKRYRFIKSTKNIQNFDDFSQITAIYSFDFEIKRIFYPMIILVETSMKNRTIDAVVTRQNSDIESIYKTKLTDYLDYDRNSNDKKEIRKFRDGIKGRLDFRSVMDQTIGYNYGKNDALSHFVHNSKPIPLWVFFELITFGQFGHFISRLSKEWRLKVSEANGLQSASFNQNGRMLQNIVFTLTDLRNATMHNSAIFDANFNHDGIARGLKQFLMLETNIEDITFDKIIDYLILLIFVLKKYGYSKTEIKAYVRQFESAKERLFKSIPRSTYGSLLGMDSNKKIEGIYSFISRT